MPFLKLWIHIIWATKNRIPLLTPEIRSHLFAHIRDNARAKGIHLDFINGYTDHVHTLISLGGDQSLSKVVQLLKGESARWFNVQGFRSAKLEWQDDYIAVSVSESMVEKVRTYIESQEHHHKARPFSEEYDEFFRKYGFVELKGTKVPEN